MKLRLFSIAVMMFLLPFVGHAATVAPATLDLQGGRGTEIRSSFTIVNTQNNQTTYYLGTIPFHAKDDSGEPVFESNEPQADLASWIGFPSTTVSVPARSKVEVPFSINTPSDAYAKSYQSAITVSVAPGEIVGTNGAIVEAKTAVLVFFTVEGASEKRVDLLDFISNAKKINTSLDQTYTLRLQNQGNVYAIPNGTIVAKDVFGRTIGVRTINEEKSRILPGTTRSFHVDPGQKGFNSVAIGPLRITASVTLGEGFAPIVSQLTFWYIPLLVPVVGLLILFIGFIWFRFYSSFRK